jgi:hypothetical protein
VTIEEAELLSPVSRIVRGIEIDGDGAGSTMKSMSMSFDDEVEQGFSQAEEIGLGDGILETRQRRLSRQIVALNRIPTQEQLENGISGQTRRVVAIGIAASQGENSLTQHVHDLVRNASLISCVVNAGGETLGEAEPFVGGLEQHCATVAAPMELIELGQKRLAEKLWKENTVCRRIRSQEKASFVLKSLFEQAVSSTRRLSCLQNRE